MTRIPGDIRDPETYVIIGAAIEVHKEMGCGFLEHAYHHALAIEFAAERIPFHPQVDIPIYYKGQLLPCNYRADFLCFDAVLVEVKAMKALTPVERAQVLHYLKATRLRKALLINFGALSLEYERIVH
jgi:GxxExxY protein